MIALPIIFHSKDNPEPVWSDIPDDKLIHVQNLACAVLDKGMTSGKPSIGLRINLPDGQVVIVETSARLFVTTARTIEAKYPDLFED